MPKLHSSRRIAKVLKQLGFDLISQKGSHAKFRKRSGNEKLTVIIPMSKKEIPMGTFYSILRQSKLSKSDFK